MYPSSRMTLFMMLKPHKASFQLATVHNYIQHTCMNFTYTATAFPAFSKLLVYATTLQFASTLKKYSPPIDHYDYDEYKLCS